MKPNKQQVTKKELYENDQMPDWWDSEPTHQELIAEELSRARHEEHSKNNSDTDKWVQDAIKKGQKPF